VPLKRMCRPDPGGAGECDRPKSSWCDRIRACNACLWCRWGVWHGPATASSAAAVGAAKMITALVSRPGAFWQGPTYRSAAAQGALTRAGLSVILVSKH
jgi:hypothetical protein